MLSHPTVSLVSVVVKDPEYFQSPDVTRRVPRLSELRLFTAGSDSGDIVERCLLTGRILVRMNSGFFGFTTDSLVIAANLCRSRSSRLGHVFSTDSGSTRCGNKQPAHSLPFDLSSFHLPGTILACHPIGSHSRSNQDIVHRLGTADKGALAERRTGGDGRQDVGLAESLSGNG